MSHEPSDTPPLESPLGGLERALIDEFLQMRGHDRHSVQALSAAQRQTLLAEASVYASAKLSEVDARSKFVHDLHEIRPGRTQTGLE